MDLLLNRKVEYLNKQLWGHNDEDNWSEEEQRTKKQSTGYTKNNQRRPSVGHRWSLVIPLSENTAISEHKDNEQQEKARVNT